jgi:hypothetical protein
MCHIRARTHPSERSIAVTRGQRAEVVTWTLAGTSAARTNLMRKRSSSRPRLRGASWIEPRGHNTGIRSQLDLVAAPESCWTVQMTRWSLRRDGASPAVPAVPGALGLPAVPAGKPARRRAARLARTLRTRWWPRFLVVGVLLVVVGALLVGGAAGTWVVGAGAAVLFVIAVRALSLTPEDHRREPPVRPGGGAAGPH